MSLRCPQCGRENKSNIKFCVECGRDLTFKGTRKIILLDNRYDILDIIKSGAMGCVYKAKDTRLGNIIAIKKMFSDNTDFEDKKYKENRFKEEARLLSRLNHKGLPKVTDYFASPDPDTGETAWFLVMTFIEGEDMETFISRVGTPLPTDEAINYFRQILNILSYLHSQKPPIIYRDMKPLNIMICKDEIFLIDFGIARIFKPRQKGTMIGTPGYASPEQYKGFSEPRSDLYSLGVLMYYLLTDINPEDSAMPPFTFDSIKKYNYDVPKKLENIIMSMLEFTCERRPESAKKVLKMLEIFDKKIALYISKKNLQAKILNPVKTKPVTIQALISPSKTKQTPINLSKKYSDILEAVKQKDFEAVIMFFKGFDVNAIDKNGNTLLHEAVVRGKIKIIKLLIKFQANVNVRNENSETPLHKAAYLGQTEAAKLLIENGAYVNIKDKYGGTPLYEAVCSGKNIIVKLLIESGVNVNVQDDNGESPLHKAAHWGKTEAAKLLIESGAYIKAKDNNGETPLYKAAYYGHTETAILLIKNGADVNAKAKDDKTPLHDAASQGHTEIIMLLIDCGANVNAMKEDGNTPLHLAVIKEQIEAVKILLQNGAYANIKNKDNKTPIFIAEENNYKQIADLIHKYGAWFKRASIFFKKKIF